MSYVIKNVKMKTVSAEREHPFARTDWEYEAPLWLVGDARRHENLLALHLSCQLGIKKEIQATDNSDLDSLFGRD